MTLSETLAEKAGGIIKLQPEILDNSRKGYMMFDDGGIEAEVGEFLYGMVRILKPMLILETGTYTGISAMYMGQALKDNGYGCITTLEINQQHKERAEELWKQVQVFEHIDCVLQDSTTYEHHSYDKLIFLDSEPNLRFAELIKFYPKLDSGGYIFIHDTPRSLSQGFINSDHPEFKSWPFGDLPQQIKDWVKDGDLVPFHFPNPRGMVGFYKPKVEDYKWR